MGMPQDGSRKSTLNRYYPPVPFIVYDLDEYELSPEARDELFSRKVSPVGIRENAEYGENKFALTGGQNNFIDTTNEYRMNALGYRSGEFSADTDFVYAGCSFSFGEGAAEEDIWGTKVAKHFGYSYSNLSKPGASVQWIVKNLFNYFREYGHPKVLSCLFPDFCRLTVPVNTKIVTLKNNDYPESWITMRGLHLGGHVEIANRPKYVKKPYPLEDTLPVEIPMSMSVEYISLLAAYCASNDIKFHWATWDVSASIYMREAAKDYNYPEYLDLKNEQWHDFDVDDFRQYFHENTTIEQIIDNCYEGKCIRTNCHDDLELKHGKYFYIGSDVEWVGGPGAHFGVHRHAHTAEAFISSINGTLSETTK